MEPITFALVGFDSLQVLIPQRAIATIEMIDSLDTATEVDNAAGSLSVAGRSWPVYAPNSKFDLQPAVADSSKYCVAFDVEAQAAFAFVCDEVSSLTLASGEAIQPLPDCLRAQGSPFTGMLLREERVLFFADEQAMSQYLSVDEAA